MRALAEIAMMNARAAAREHAAYLARQAAYDRATLVSCCPFCGGEITHRGEDGIDYCPDCQTVTEGSTLLVPAGIWEAGPEAVLAYDAAPSRRGRQE